MRGALILIAVLCFGQEPTLKPTTSAPKTDPPTLLSLEVKYNPNLPPAYISVRGAETKPRWIWVTRFVRNNQPANGDLPIHAVRVESQFNGETADIKVTVFRGRNESFEREDPVAVYHIGLNEPTTIPELKSFGIEPFSLTLLNVVPPLPPSPILDNRTETVEIISVRLDNVPLPAYHLTLRNLSDKNIRALRIEVIHNGRPGVSGLWQGERDRPLIEAGGVLERSMPVAVAQKTAAGYAPGTAASSTIRIRTAVFDDLTFDGEDEAACQYEKYVVGRTLWLKRVLPFIEQQLANPALSPQEFKQKFQSLTFELDETERTGKSSVSAKCPNPDSFTNISTNGLTFEINRELDRIINTRPAPPINFREWLESHRDDYKSWLARLK
ncbi:MAG TPA: hypothetical protein VLB87_01685 [Pyrinomonadaceae bacterium]|nr:hypothetical protein [Pyrinomonadaceae bacterium]